MNESGIQVDHFTLRGRDYTGAEPVHRTGWQRPVIQVAHSILWLAGLARSSIACSSGRSLAIRAGSRHNAAATAGRDLARFTWRHRLRLQSGFPEPLSASRQPLMLDLGCQNSIDVIRQFVPLGGRQVIDAGCGDLSLAGELANSGACVLAIDPDPEQARINRAQNSIEGVEFAETGAEKIPLPSASAAGVFFSYSLHHVPGAMYAAVFDEVFRVLDGDGFLMVIEPVSCPLYDDVVKRFHDEDHARAAAWNALAKLAIPRFERVEDVTFHKWVEYESFDHFVQRFASRSFNSIYSESDIRCEAVEAAFLRVGGSGHRFHANSRALILQGLRSVQSSLRGEPGR